MSVLKVTTRRGVSIALMAAESVKRLNRTVFGSTRTPAICTARAGDTKEPRLVQPAAGT
jgi:hypothetical protein